MAMEQPAQRIAGGFAAPADFAALHADRIDAVCRMQAAEGRELTRVWEIGHELEEVRLTLTLTLTPTLTLTLTLTLLLGLPRSDAHGAAIGARGQGGGTEEVRRSGGADGAAARAGQARRAGPTQPARLGGSRFPALPLSRALWGG